MRYSMFTLSLVLCAVAYPLLCSNGGMGHVDRQERGWCSYRSDGSNSGSVDGRRNRGKVRWVADVPDGVPSEVVACKQHMALFTIKSTSGGTKLCAVDCRAGVLRWARPISAIQSYYGPPTPAVDESGNVYVSTAEGHMLAFVAQNGKALWTFTAPRGEGAKRKTGTPSSPKIDASTAYFVADGVLYALDRSSGTERWRAKVGVLNLDDAPAVDAQGSIYVVSDMGLLAVERDTGKVTWRMPNVGPYPAFGVPVLINSNRICESGAEEVTCVDPLSRKTCWAATFPGRELTHLALYEGHTLFANTRAGRVGKLLALDVTTGQVKWTYSPVTSGAGGDPCANNRSGIVLTTVLPKLIAVDGKTGRRLWGMNLHLGTFASSPSIGPDGTIYIADGGGKLYAVE